MRLLGYAVIVLLTLVFILGVSFYCYSFTYCNYTWVSWLHVISACDFGR